MLTINTSTNAIVTSTFHEGKAFVSAMMATETTVHKKIKAVVPIAQRIFLSVLESTNN